MGKQWKKAGKQEQASKKGALFTKLSREIQVAVRLGGPLPDNNPRLKLALQTARAHLLPKDTIKRAIAKGQGAKERDSTEEVLYEGFGPAGVAFLISCRTDNRTRTVSEMRCLFKKHKGHIGESGSVMWMFEKTTELPTKNQWTKDSITNIDQPEQVYSKGEWGYQAKHKVTLDTELEEKAKAILQEIKNHPDCQSVWTNFNSAG